MNLWSPIILVTSIALFHPLQAQSSATAVDSALQEAIAGDANGGTAELKITATWGDVLNALASLDVRSLREMVPPLAKAGDRDAQLLLGMMHRFGLGMDCNDDLFRKWIRKAADQGEPAAARILVSMLLAENQEGESLGQIMLYKRIASAGKPRLALEWLSLLPEEESTNWGVSFELNMDLALVNSDPTACFNLSQFYAVGLGTERNLRTGQVWLRKAAASGHAGALYELARCYDPNSSLVKSFQSMGLELPEITDPVKATAYYEKAAEAGDLKALLLVARAYETGRGVEKNPEKAFRFYKAAAAQDDAMSQGQLAWCYDNGFGTAEDKVAALQWYRAATRSGNSWAWGRLGLMYEKGVIHDPNPAEALRCYKQGALEGDAFSQRKYGFALSAGKDVPTNVEEAAFWFSRSAAQRDEWSAFYLARAYYLGRGTTTDWNKAANLFERAAEAGIDYAWFYLGTIYKLGHTTEAADAPRSTMYYKRGADAGDVDCLVSAGLAALTGDGTPVDKAEAFRLLDKATAVNSANAYLAKAYALAVRDGEKVDAAELRKNLDLAVTAGSARASDLLAFASVSPLSLPTLVQQLLRPFYSYGNSDWSAMRTAMAQAKSVQGDTPPLLAFRVSPSIPVTYTPTGSVTLLMEVDTKGQVASAVVENSTEPLLDAACIAAAQQYLFLPGVKAKQPATFKVRQNFDFSKFTRLTPDSGADAQ
ncbi:MAG: energy transducer TonB [Verrucomicrobiota bacterium]|nr:energy transducer TonB [Verrucomicrobiota bacterium]